MELNKKELLILIDKLYAEKKDFKDLKSPLLKLMINQYNNALMDFLKNNNENDAFEIIDALFSLYLKQLNKDEKVFINEHFWGDYINMLISSLLKKETKKLFKNYFNKNTENYLILFENMKTYTFMFNVNDELDLKTLIYVTPDLKDLRDFKLLPERENPILLSLIERDKNYSLKILKKNFSRNHFLEYFKECNIFLKILHIIILPIVVLLSWLIPFFNLIQLLFDYDKSCYTNYLNINRKTTELDILDFLVKDSTSISNLKNLIEFKVEMPVAFNKEGKLIEWDMYLMHTLY